MTTESPLEGILVLDVSRMLPGAVLARCLVDLGARVIKIEDPAGGDPMRHVGGGAAFGAFFRGGESVCLDLREEADRGAFLRLVKHADVVVESFRHGTMARFGLALDRLRELNPVLITCSLSGSGAEEASRPVHDLNLAGLSGALREMGEGVPRIQLADTTTGLLASTAILAALLARHRTGRGRHVEQPLSAGPLPFLTAAYAESAGSGVAELLSGSVPCYRTYRCGGGTELAVGCLEPKFWTGFVEALGLDSLAGDGLDRGERGREAARRVSELLLTAPADHWLSLFEGRELPVTRVRTIAEALEDAYYRKTGLTGSYLASTVAAEPARSAPLLGEGTERVLREFGVR